MKFGPIPIDQAVGKILGHNIAGPDGRRLFRKGHTITQNDLAALHSTGRTAVYVAQLEPDDVDEDSAAVRIPAPDRHFSREPPRRETWAVSHASKPGVKSH